MIGQQKNNRTLYKLSFNRKTCNHFLKSRCISELSWNFLKNTNVQVFLFFSRAPDIFLMSSHALDYMTLFYFYLVSFTFSISYSVLPFQVVYVFQFLHLFFFFDVLSQAFIKCSRKAFLHTYINSMYNIYILENLGIFA